MKPRKHGRHRADAKQSLASTARVATLAILAALVVAVSGAGLVGVDASAGAAGTALAAAPGRSISKERAIRSCVNAERGKRGLRLLQPDPALGQAARLHARSMARGGFVGHTDRQGRGPAERVAEFTDRFGEGVGENAAGGYPTAAATCRGWMNSSGHRANFLNPDYRHIGTGYAAGGRWRHSWVQVFGLDPDA